MCLQFEVLVFTFQVEIAFNLVCSAKFKVSIACDSNRGETWDTVLRKKFSVSIVQFQIDLTSHPLRSFPTMAFHDSLNSQHGACPLPKTSANGRSGSGEQRQLLSFCINHCLLKKSSTILFKTLMRNSMKKVWHLYLPSPNSSWLLSPNSIK